ncbi:Gfo/Idh/MocA family protein [Vibrio panuliri]|uniref:Oxidoreductase n=1 Tax=Vibrio panuliri TaxID=1381081 RepID=A0A1Q9HG34_9VIBR|nr:Gfo/Idh/MocA family oxidoreductase [Vibrio panuliri]KAB1459750.1 Gfo/Idh/MocA family oxidoreductase [Vibrio panuliri]OLQ86525.1 oxidoreductase [Vibrio panuliri]OLQ88698.1 oxidoreductase [Vibrio panuliri]
MKVALIGLGDIATKAYLPVLSQIQDIELILCTRNEQVLTALAHQYRIKTFVSDYKKLIALNIDAVMVHSATSTHSEIASFFLSHGIATFVDKPLADRYQHVEMLYELAERHQVPLYVGFNRRHIPLYNHHLPTLQQGNIADILSFRWEKNRFQLPGELNTFIFDDFIHPLDSVNVTAKSTLDDVYVTTQRQGNQLARLDVQWQQGQTLLHASMNRQFGITTERVQVCLENQVYEFDSFTSGVKLSESKQEKIAEKDWTPMLKGKGFHSMMDDWFSVVRNNKLDNQVVQRNLASHHLAELLYQKIRKEIA